MMEDKFKYVVVDSLDSVLKSKIEFFRRNTSTISGRVRTDEEWEVHIDKYCSDADIKK